MPDNIPEPPVITPTEPEVTPAFTNEEIKKQSFEEIAKNTEVPEVKVEPTEEEKAKVAAEAKAKADAEAAKKAEEEEQAVEPAELAEDISKRIAEKLSPREATVQKSKYDEFFEKTKAEKGREPNWIELSEFLEEQAVLRMEAKQKEVQETQAKQKEEEAKVNEAFTKRLNSQIDEELEELYKSGGLSPIKDKNNPSDQGVLERRALFQAMLDTNAKRVAEGKDAITSVARIFHGGYYTKPSAKPAGEDAPISMGKGTPSGGEEEQEVDYKEIHNKGWNLFGRK
jgi:hypothetical protein